MSIIKSCNFFIKKIGLRNKMVISLCRYNKSLRHRESGSCHFGQISPFTAAKSNALGLFVRK